MSDNLHRTAEWDRLARSGLFAVIDGPGAITLSCPPRHLKRILVALAAVWVVQIIMSATMGWFSLLWFVMFTGLSTVGLGSGVTTILRYGSRVHVTPDRVEFWNAWGSYLGGLDREGMQQIAVEHGDKGLVFHRFIADTGFISAFPDNRKTTALLKNNVLMAAFAQPLELDLATGFADEFQPMAEAAPALHLVPQGRVH